MTASLKVIPSLPDFRFSFDVLSMDEVKNIKERWQGNVDIERLCSEVETLDAAWRSAEDASFYAYRDIARMKGILLKAKKSGALSQELMAAIDEAIKT